MRTILTLLALAGVMAGCGREDPVSQSIAAAVENGSGTRLVLAEHTAFEWDKVCVIGPYTPDDRVDSLTGIQGAAGLAHGIRSSDAINVLMFISKDRVAASIAHPRNKGDFAREVNDTCYSRSQAKFLIRVPPAESWGDIGPG
jgi:hypothetical protein